MQILISGLNDEENLTITLTEYSKSILSSPSSEKDDIPFSIITEDFNKYQSLVNLVNNQISIIFPK